MIQAAIRCEPAHGKPGQPSEQTSVRALRSKDHRFPLPRTQLKGENLWLRSTKSLLSAISAETRNCVTPKTARRYAISAWQPRNGAKIAAARCRTSPPGFASMYGGVK